MGGTIAASFDMKIVLGDFNAQVGTGSLVSPTIGKHSLSVKTSDNGERMFSVATSRSLKALFLLTKTNIEDRPFPSSDIAQQL